MSLLAVPRRTRSKLNRPLWRMNARDSLYNQLVEFWPMNEAAGKPAIGVLGHHLTDNNTVGSAAGVSAHTGNSRDFTAASNHYLSLANDKLGKISPVASDFTICGWYRHPATADYHSILAIYTTSGNNREYILRSGTSDFDLVWHYSEDGSVVTAFAGPDTSTANTWVFFCVRYDHANMMIRTNDGADSTSSFTGDVYDGTGIFTMGGDNGGSDNSMNSRLGGVGFWSRAITDAESLRLYNGGLGWSYPF